jgi:hypothetical protein
MRPRFDTWSPCTQTGQKSLYAKLSMFPLADSERQEISAAFDEAELKIKEAAEATQALLKVLEQKSAFIGKGRIELIRKCNIPLGSAIFELSVQRYKMLKFGAARALK